jgi:hypothetical protein
VSGESELVPEIDSDELRAVLRTVSQGDLLDVGKMVFLWSPDAPSHPSEVAGVPHEEPLMSEEIRLSSGLCAIVGQDCDIRRLPDVEPYLLVCPLSEADDKIYKEASDDMSVRYFAYPQIEDHEHQQLAVDARMIQSVEKTALLSSHVNRLPCPLSGPRRTAFRNWIGRRLGRDAFPDEVVKQVVEPIEQAIKRAREKDAENVFPCVIWTGLRWTPGKTYCSLLLLTDPALRAQQGVDAEQVDLMLGRLRKALNHFVGKAGDYSVIANARDATEASAATMLEHYELALDLDALTLD